LELEGEGRGEKQKDLYTQKDTNKKALFVWRPVSFILMERDRL
jgi:hypothetical protein